MTTLDLVLAFSEYVRGIRPYFTGMTRRSLWCIVHCTHDTDPTADLNGTPGYQRGMIIARGDDLSQAWSQLQRIPPVLYAAVDGFDPWEIYSTKWQKKRFRGYVTITLAEPVTVTLEFYWPHPLRGHLAPNGTLTVTVLPTAYGRPDHVQLVGRDPNSGGIFVIELLDQEYAV